jgi:hypothetical protein
MLQNNKTDVHYSQQPAVLFIHSQMPLKMTRSFMRQHANMYAISAIIFTSAQVRIY